MFKKLPIGTFINMATVTVGSLIGMSLQQSFPPEIKDVVFQAIGLSILLIGIMMAQKIPDGYLLLLIFSMLIGGIIGQSIHLDQVLQDLGDGVKAIFNIQDTGFSEGLVTTFILFCVGSMTIVGAIEEGISGKRELLLIKSLLDGFTSIALASTYGVSVLFSIFPMLLFQGGITILAFSAQRIFTNEMIGILSSCGGLLIVALGINMLQIGQVNVENLLPALVVAGILAWGYQRYKQSKEETTSLAP